MITVAKLHNGTCLERLELSSSTSLRTWARVQFARFLVVLNFIYGRTCTYYYADFNCRLIELQHCCLSYLNIELKIMDFSYRASDSSELNEALSFRAYGSSKFILWRGRRTQMVSSTGSTLTAISLVPLTNSGSERE